jgi:uncharacterized protein (DUF362 family)
MTEFTRRDFLRLAALGMGSLAMNRYLAACNPQSIPGQLPTPTLPPATAIPPTAGVPSASETAASSPGSATQTSPPASSPTVAGAPDLVVARNGDPETLVRRAIAALGGMEQFVPQGARVVVKPNICVDSHTYEYAATTNPWVVAALVRLAYEAGARSVKVMDYPFGGTAEQAYVHSGIQEQVLAAGGEMVTMSGFRYVDVDIPAGKWLKKTQVFDEILNTDVLIDVPIAKQHSAARLTLGMKNLMGVVRNRSAMHGSLGQAIADLNTLVRPRLTVIDAVRILLANGPTGGNLNDVQQLDTIIASADIVAADSYATSFFGLQPDAIEYIRYGGEMGLGRSDLSNLKIEEISL